MKKELKLEELSLEQKLGMVLCANVHSSLSENEHEKILQMIREHRLGAIYATLNSPNKEEIIRISRNIDTFETSILPYEDCCTVFTPKHPKTRPTLELCEDAEKNLKIEELIEKAIKNTEYSYID